MTVAVWTLIATVAAFGFLILGVVVVFALSLYVLNLWRAIR